MNLKRMIYLVLGFICLGAGCVGVVLPLLPSFPFFVGTAFFFAKSSDRLHRWFRGTSLYKEHLEPFLNKKGMTVQTKIRIIVMVTILMTFGVYHDEKRADRQDHSRGRLARAYRILRFRRQEIRKGSGPGNPPFPARNVKAPNVLRPAAVRNVFF